MRRATDVAFTVALGLVGVSMVYRAWHWPFSARLLPLSVGVVFLLLVLVQGHAFLRTARAGLSESDHPAGQRYQVAAPTETEIGDRRDYLVHGVWVLVFALAVWLAGFAVGGIVSLAAYLVYARARWTTVVLMSLVAIAFYWAATNWMQIRFPEPVLW